MNKVKFTTTRFGIIEVESSKIIKFIDELPGFPGASDFVLIPHSENSPFSWLQSVNFPELAFVVADPWLFFDDFKPIVCEADIEVLETSNHLEDHIAVLTILTIPNDPHAMTANLKAPVIINSQNNKAKQVILLNDNYTTKHLVIPGS